ncbi:MAG: hypothetical protein JNN12_04275 [Bacteroidetes Order II. Incertae sedis bacterium]|nr:hypothetical protein [Bacteroidetes Order II. bacterium]
MRRKKTTIEQFRDRLISQYNQNRPDTDQVSRWFMMVVAVCISLLLWFTLNMRKSYTYEVSLPVVLQQLPDGYMPLNAFPKEVQVEVSGVGWQLLQLSQQPPPIGVNVKNTGSARRIDFQKLIQPRQFPMGVSIVKITPAQTLLELDKKTTKRVPVQFRGKISYSTTYEAVRKPVFEPTYVTVVGPERILRNLSVWPIKEQNFKNVRASINEMVQLSDTLSGLVESNISDAMLIVPVEQFTESSRSLRVEVTDLPANVSRVQFNPPQVEVVYRVPVSQFKQAEESEGFRAYVSYERIAADYSDGTVTASIETPKGLNVRLSRVIHRKLSYFIVRDEGN